MWINVEHYGAVGDGQTKDAVVIQAALDEARCTEKGVTVIIPAGTYRLEKTLYVSSNTHIIAAPSARLVRDHDGYLVTNGRPEESFEGYDGHSNITIEGGIWDFNGVIRRKMHNCFAIGHGENITLQRMEIRDVAGAHAIEVCGCRNVWINGCRFLGFIDTGGRSFSEAVQIDLMKAVGVFSAFGAYDQTTCENIWVNDCYFGSSNTEGSQVWPRGIGSHSSTIGVWHENIMISSNVFDGLTKQAVRGYSWKNLQVHHNQFLHCGAGIEVASPPLSDAKDTKDIFGKQTGASQPCENVEIVSNIITGGLTYHHGIAIIGERTGILENVSISGNIISDPADQSSYSGVSILYGDTVKVTSNILKNIKGTAIITNKGNRYSIHDNTITRTGGDGIVVTGPLNGVDIKNNSIQSIQENGISISENVKMAVIHGNTIYGVNGRNIDAFPISINQADYVTISANNYFNEKPEFLTSTMLNISSSCNQVIQTGNHFLNPPRNASQS
ncbi:right-handed parallel beta-helix repeat-containing protein [Sediminibacillus halophilus]|uniref:Polygalacturonase n=1 Tax=Sediminibacillus halophilus TaxID=482461 RepID=A0A1G9PBM5_9BACI|nr:right-handed parallel beta-helix repeat-containing protein [Sediminibacillus halophilus]SDL96272.1 Polygalacturonase [Sediminibacillus halophilus]